MKVRDLMQRDLATLAVEDDLALVDGLMRLGRIRHLPVVSGDRVVGIVSQRDLFRAGMSSLIAGAGQRDWLARIRVDEVMSREVVIVHPEASVRSAVELMLREKIGCLPVVEDERLVGLLSETDCMRHLARLLECPEGSTGVRATGGAG